jgi:hypothetical protein
LFLEGGSVVKDEKTICGEVGLVDIKNITARAVFVEDC